MFKHKEDMFMSISQKQKDKIIHYMLDKIEMNENVVKKTIECFKISHTTVYRYLKELEAANLITKSKNGEYILVNTKSIFNFDNKNLEEDSIYYNNIEKIIEDLPSNVRKIWTYAFTEMFNNAIEHSEAKKIKCVVYRNYINTVIIIVDNGIGIFKKIKEFYNFNSLDDAISELFKGKLTTAREGHSGEGIFFTSRLMDVFMLFSDNKVFTHDNHMECIDNIDEYSELGELLKGKGTLVFMSLDNTSHKELREVFDNFSDVDGGLTKTSIPMKNVFGNAFPVSRSQARRLCNRLDQFKEVELDFYDVDEIGQGFADELFGKFASRHPEVKLIVTNTNPFITRMIAHIHKQP